MYNFIPDYAIITSLNRLLCELVFLIKNNNKVGFIYSTAKWLDLGLEWPSPGTVCFPTHITPINVFQVCVACRKSPNCANFHTLVQGREIFIGKEDKTIYNCRHNYNIITSLGDLKTDHQTQTNFIVLVSCDLVEAPRDKFFLSEGMRVSEMH